MIVVFGSIIGFVYGWWGAVTALPCLCGGAGVLLIPWTILTAIEYFLDKNDPYR